MSVNIQIIYKPLTNQFFSGMNQFLRSRLSERYMNIRFELILHKRPMINKYIKMVSIVIREIYIKIIVKFYYILPYSPQRIRWKKLKTDNSKYQREFEAIRNCTTVGPVLCMCVYLCKCILWYMCMGAYEPIYIFCAYSEYSVYIHAQ